MSAEQSLYALLLAGSPQNAVAALVADRVYPIVVPEGHGLPSIAYQRTSTEYITTIGSETVAAHVTFDLFCVDDNFSGAEAVANAVAQIVEDNSDEVEKLDRSHSFDAETGSFAVVLTIRLWE